MTTAAGHDISQLDISEQELDRLVGEMVRHVIFKTQQTSGCPIKRDELTQLVSKHYSQRSLPTVVINKTIEKLSNVFGYEMKELQRSRSKPNQGRTSQQGSTDAKSYILTSKLNDEVYKKYVADESQSHLTGLTFVIVGIVSLAGGKISEDNLWHHLRQLELSQTEENHPVFGNTKQFLETLVQQRFLMKEKVNGPEGSSLFYELAERSLDVSVSQRIKDHIAQIVQREVPTPDGNNDDDEE
ncbi:melanoma-associated antigen B1 [Impatiens glandulifera]|uniref:melanoma-associated antigen B1 n=1 Tax=Impatiens glandulifera TaxID=253017 RepID=UPI001FB1A101|nr:melanoma-associated antigen B1 [Impatiens glandulifera]